MLRLALGHPGRHHAHPDLAHELDADPGRGVGALEVVDELGEVLDAADQSEISITLTDQSELNIILNDQS